MCLSQEDDTAFFVGRDLLLPYPPGSAVVRLEGTEVLPVEARPPFVEALTTDAEVTGGAGDVLPMCVVPDEPVETLPGLPGETLLLGLASPPGGLRQEGDRGDKEEADLTDVWSECHMYLD